MMELEPFGMTAGMGGGRPIMLFREKGGEAILPVWLSPLDAGIAITQHNVRATAMSPHDLPLRLLEKVGVKVRSCRFCEVIGHQQYVELKFGGLKRLKPMRFRADFAVSFCLQARAKFYCTREYLETCREVDAAIDRVQVSLNQRADSGRGEHPYLN